MKAFLLCAGRATRLRPLTDNIPKCLIPIRGTPVLAIWLEICRRTGIDEVLINLHWQADAVRQFLRRFRTPVKVTLTYEHVLLGGAGTVRENWKWVQSERRFWVIYTDVLTSTDLRKLAAFDHDKDGILTMGLHTVLNPKDSGLVTLDAEGRIAAFEEKPQHSSGNLAFAGLLLARPSLIRYLPHQPVLDFGHDVFPRLTGKMWGYIMKGYVLDIGTPARLAQAQETWPGFQHSDGQEHV